MHKRRANNPGPRQGRKKAKKFPQTNTLDRYAVQFREVKGQEFNETEFQFNCIDWDNVPAEVIYLPSTSSQLTLAEQQVI